MGLWDYLNLPEEELVERINEARKKRNAVILAHNYQRIEVQRIADFRGDSLELAKIASKTDAEVIVFCGVMFMAETAKIVNPERTVLIPDFQAGCPLAAYATADKVLEFKKMYPDHAVVTYINSSAEVKAVSDIVCTSANPVKVVEYFPKDKGIIFVPDKNLCYYTKKQTGRENIICWEGNCYVHDRITLENVRHARQEHPEAVLIVHPEVPPEVQEVADFIASTSGMYRYVKEHPDTPAIIATEVGLIERIKDEIKGAKVYPISERAICSNMKLITLPKVLMALEENVYEVVVPDEIAEKARTAIERMLSVS